MDDTKEGVLKLLEEVYPQDLPISEIAKRLGISRNTTSKYVAILEAEGKIDLKEHLRCCICELNRLTCAV